MPPPRKTWPIFRQSSNLALDGCLCRTISNWPRDDNWTLIQIRKIKLWPSTFEMAFKSANNFSQNLMACLTSKIAISYTYDWIFAQKRLRKFYFISVSKVIWKEEFFQSAYLKVHFLRWQKSILTNLYVNLWALKLGFFSQFSYDWHFLPLVQIFYVECTQIKRHQWNLDSHNAYR